MPLFGPKKKKVVRATEEIGPSKRVVYDYVDMDVPISPYDRDVDGRLEHVGPSVQRREVRSTSESKPSFLGLRRKRKADPTLFEKGGEEAGKHADFMEK